MSDDIHICGACKAQFSEINLFLTHKNGGCSKNDQHLTTQHSPRSTGHRPSGDINASETSILSLPLGNFPTSSIVSALGVTDLLMTAVNRPPGGAATTVGLTSPSKDNMELLNLINTTTMDVSAAKKSVVSDVLSKPIRPDQHPMIQQSSRFVCDFPDCNYSFGYLKDMQRHKQVHTVVVSDVLSKPIRPDQHPMIQQSSRFVCDFPDCNYSFGYLKDMQRHKRVHTGEKPFHCEICDRSYARKDKLTIHLRNHTGQKPFKCDICNYAGSDSSSVRKHMRVHTGERPYKCQICPYASKNSSQLTVHLRTHTGDCPFLCHLCDAQFKINSDLKRHVRIHTKEKPFACPDCDFKCAVRGNLNSHIKVNHSEQSEMKCDECEFVTSSKRRYQEHKKTHSEADFLACSKCGYLSSSKSALKVHMSSHSRKKTHFKCYFCTFSANTKTQVQQHTVKKHPEIIRSKKVAKKSSTNSKSNKPSGKSVMKLEGRLKNIPARPYKCHVCSVAFVREDSLKSHVKQHCKPNEVTQAAAEAVLQLQNIGQGQRSLGGQNLVLFAYPQGTPVIVPQSGMPLLTSQCNLGQGQLCNLGQGQPNSLALSFMPVHSASSITNIDRTLYSGVAADLNNQTFTTASSITTHSSMPAQTVTSQSANSFVPNFDGHHPSDALNVQSTSNVLSRPTSNGNVLTSKTSGSTAQQSMTGSTIDVVIQGKKQVVISNTYGDRNEKLVQCSDGMDSTRLPAPMVTTGMPVSNSALPVSAVSQKGQEVALTPVGQGSQSFEVVANLTTPFMCYNLDPATKQFNFKVNSGNQNMYHQSQDGTGNTNTPSDVL